MSAPRPPFLPHSPEVFLEHVAKHASVWYEYCRLAYEYIKNSEETVTEAREQANRLGLELRTVQKEAEYRLQECQKELDRACAVKEYQEDQLQKIQDKYVKALEERSQALHMVNTPTSTPIPEHAAGRPPVAPVGALASSTTPSSSEVTRLSERLPDPDKFNGDRTDLRRFIAQIQEKMTANSDRFPTPNSRTAYVNGRLTGAAYAQVLPFIRDGVCQLPDYKDILDLLEKAFGDPNRSRNARNELYRLRQANREFSTFFAEFQRLALEGEMPETALPTLLEQAISRELKGMLLHHEPPSWEYHSLANFLQSLDSRLREYNSKALNATQTYTSISKSTQRPQSPRTSSPATIKTANQFWHPSTQKSEPAPVQQPDPMDLSTTRRLVSRGFNSSRRETGACFRCGSMEHYLRNCPHPDTRQRVHVMSPYEPLPESPPKGRVLEPRSSSPSQTSLEKGVSLE